MKSLNVLSRIILLMVSIASSHSTEWNGFESYRSFLNADPAVLRARIHFTPLDQTRSLDRTTLAFLHSIEETTRTTSKISWGEGAGAFAHPLSGIVIDRKQLDSFQTEFTGAEFKTILLFVIAHEHAHMRQYAEYGKEIFLNEEKTRELELQADILAGAMVGIVTAKEGQRLHSAGQPILKDTFKTNTFVRLGVRIGHPSWNDGTKHPRADQRSVGAGIGLDGGLQWLFLEQYLGHKKDGHEEEAKKWLVDIKAHDKRWPFMPQLLPSGDKPEYSLDWSQRVARKMLETDFGYYDFVREYRRKNDISEE
jgi:hypothetical protein